MVRYTQRFENNATRESHHITATIRTDGEHIVRVETAEGPVRIVRTKDVDTARRHWVGLVKWYRGMSQNENSPGTWKATGPIRHARPVD